MSQIYQQLAAGWLAWEDVYGALRQNVSRAERYRIVHESLCQFNPDHDPGEDHIKPIIFALSKGYHLTAAAVKWGNPVAGSSPAEGVTTTDELRGKQWRLVMSYGGFETIAKALLGKGRGGLGPPEFQRLVAGVDLVPYQAVPAPKRTRAAIERWLDFGDTEGQSVMLRFLSMSGGDAKSLHRWLVEGQAVEDYVEALCLTKAIRNATAHGALSPTKCNRWGFKPALDRLPLDVGHIVAACLKRLTERIK